MAKGSGGSRPQGLSGSQNRAQQSPIQQYLDVDKYGVELSGGLTPFFKNENIPVKVVRAGSHTFYEFETKYGTVEINKVGNNSFVSRMSSDNVIIPKGSKVRMTPGRNDYEIVGVLSIKQLTAFIRQNKK